MATPKLQKRFWIAGLIGLVSVTGAYMYYQVNKILDYTLNYKGIKNVKITKDQISFTMWYEYQNKANITITLAESKYDVYVENQYVTTLTNFAPTTLQGGQVSVIEVNVVLTKADLTKLKLNYAQLLIAPKSVEIKTIMKWKVKYGIFKFPVTYPYIVSLKEVISWYVPVINKI